MGEEAKMKEHRGYSSYVRYTSRDCFGNVEIKGVSNDEINNRREADDADGDLPF